MGEVYRARDTKLDRDVAIKVLPANLAGNAERLSRLEREAKLLAALNHPNIAHIYGLGEAPGGRALVMELVQPKFTLSRSVSAGRSLPGATELPRDIVFGAHQPGHVFRSHVPRWT